MFPMQRTVQGAHLSQIYTLTDCGQKKQNKFIKLTLSNKGTKNSQQSLD
jgi:hypothetical protein